jgi:hypothetical protein
MGSAYFIVLEPPIAGLDASMDGKALATKAADLDWTAKEIGVRPLSEFLSVDPEVAREFFENGGGSDARLPELNQFSADEGLKSVQALLREIQAWPPSTKETDRILSDLRDCERILRAAVEHGVHWHFEVDF